MEIDDTFFDELSDVVECGGGGAAPKLNSLLRLWILRILVRMNGHRTFVRGRDFSDDDIASALGFGRLISLDSEFSRRDIVAKLRAQHDRAEAERSKARPPAVLARNIKRLAKLLDLSPADCRVLEFAVMINNDATLDNACDLLGHSLSTPAMTRVLSRILGLPIKGVEAAVNPTGILSRSGLLTVNRNGGGTVRSKLDLLSTSFADRMLSTDADPVELLRGTVALAPPPQLALSDYGHLGVSLDLLRPYLKIALAERRRGVNIFGNS